MIESVWLGHTGNLGLTETLEVGSDTFGGMRPAGERISD
jgi:hypothetical protein